MENNLNSKKALDFENWMLKIGNVYYSNLDSMESATLKIQEGNK